MFPELQEFVMSLKHNVGLISRVAIVNACLSLAAADLQIRIFLSRCLIGRIFFVFQHNNITFVVAQLVKSVLVETTREDLNIMDKCQTPF